MIALALNLTVPNYAVGLFTEKGVQSFTFSTDFARTETIVDDIDTLLNSQKLTLKDLSRIGVIQGPGSYTGSRIACTIANTLSQVHHTPIIGFSSLEILAHQTALTQGIYIVTMPRTKYDLNVALFSSNGHTISRLTQDFTWSIEMMVQKCSQFKEPITIVGCGHADIQAKLAHIPTLYFHTTTLSIDTLLTQTCKAPLPSTPSQLLPLYSSSATETRPKEVLK